MMSKTYFGASILLIGTIAALAGCGGDPNTLTMEQPGLTSLLPGVAQYGDTIEVGGSGFGTDPSTDLIVISPDRFSDPAARRTVVPFSGSSSVLRGIVPDGAFAGSIRIERTDVLGGAMSLGLPSPYAASNTLSFASRLLAGDVGKSFFSGSDYDFEINAGLSSEDYLVVLFSSAVAPSNEWTYLYDITAQSATASADAAPAPSLPAPSPRPSASRPEKAASDLGMLRRDFRTHVDEEIRELLAGARGANGAQGAQSAQGATSAVDRRETIRPAIAGPGAPAQTVHFQVLIDPMVSVLNPTNFETIEAELKYSGDHTLLYVDVETPASCLSDAEAENLGLTFDANIYGTDRGSFGSESDINRDGRVAILMSPNINLMTPAGSAGTQGFIAGYFLANDLVPNIVGDSRMTNSMEIFYSMIPDPTGIYGNEFPKDKTLPVIEGVLAHEFLHMILFNYRVLIYGSGWDGSYMEETWLNEGLAHIAEDLNDYTSSNVARANRYLADPGKTTLIYGGDTLEERGASFLFLRHLGDRFGSAIFRRLVQSREYGADNIEAATGEYFTELFADWSAACYLSGRGITDDPRFNYSTLDLQGDFDPIRTIAGNVSGMMMQGYVRSVAPEYIMFTIPAGATAQFSIGSSATGKMNATVIRLR